MSHYRIRDPQLTLQVLAAALTVSSLLLLVLFALLRRRLAPAEGLEALGWAAAAVALASPLVAMLVRGEGLVAGALPADPEAVQRVLPRRIAFFAVLEAAVLLCAVALLVSPGDAALAAAFVPLAVMLLNWPRSREA